MSAFSYKQKYLNYKRLYLCLHSGDGGGVGDGDGVGDGVGVGVGGGDDIFNEANHAYKMIMTPF